ELPSELRPRERLRAHGAAALSPAELLALVIGTGTRGRSALAAGTALLTRFGSLAPVGGGAGGGGPGLAGDRPRHGGADPCRPGARPQDAGTGAPTPGRPDRG